MTHSPSAPAPKHVLLVSATIGEGHNATARAIENRARYLWPDCEVTWLDTLDVMGPGVGPLFRWIYVRNVESTPWLYDLFYAALWRHHWFADASRRFVGAWCGRFLRPLVRRHRPDLVVSTYPMGTAGLDWMRRHGELDVPVTAVVSDFSPHPFWVYSEIDLHYVMSTASLHALYRAQPDAAAAVCVPPVMPEFRPRDKQTCRRELSLPQHGFLVLVSCGSLGFGSVERAVDTALAVPEVDGVIVACGRNESLHARLTARPEAGDRLVPMGWVEDMPTLTSAADVVVSNAGGATALEALACGRTVVMFEPIAGHGRGNAELMDEAGLAELCPSRHELATTLERLGGDPARLHESQQRALSHATSGDLTEQVAALARQPHHRGTRALSAQDAFFVHAATEEAPQQTGAVLLLAANPEMSVSDWTRHLSGLIERRAPHVPILRRRLVRRARRRAVWVDETGIEPNDHLDHRTVGASHSREWEEVVREFFATAVRTDRPPWELLLVHDADSGEAALLAKLHHALGDGVVVTNSLINLLQDSVGEPSRPALARSRQRGRRWAERCRQAATGIRGVASLAAAGTAPASGLDGPSTPRRRFGWAELSSEKVRASARVHEVRTSVLLVSVLAEALHRLLDERGGTTAGQQLRVMVPQTMRSLGGGDDALVPGNRTVTVAMDLPIGPMAPLQRLTEVATRLSTTQRHGQPIAAGAVMAMLGLLPDPLHAWVVRRIYQRRFFNALVSVLPGARNPPHVHGSLVRGVLPVLPLADGVGLGMGAIVWGDMIGVGITADTGLVPAPEQLADHVRAAFDDLQDLSGRDREP